MLYQLRGSKGKVQPVQIYHGEYLPARDAGIAHAARFYRTGASLTITIWKPQRIQRTLHSRPFRSTHMSLLNSSLKLAHPVIAQILIPEVQPTGKSG